MGPDITMPVSADELPARNPYDTNDPKNNHYAHRGAASNFSPTNAHENVTFAQQQRSHPSLSPQGGSSVAARNVTPATQTRMPSFQGAAAAAGAPPELPDEYYYDTQDLDVYRLFVQPRYLKINKRTKFKSSFFKRLFLAQELDTTTGQQNAAKRQSALIEPSVSNSVFSDSDSGAAPSNASARQPDSEATRTTAPAATGSDKSAVWCLKFSPDGKYLAAGGKDSVIRVYKVISSPLDRLDYEHNKVNLDLLRKPVNGLDLTSVNTNDRCYIDFARDGTRIQDRGRLKQGHSVSNSKRPGHGPSKNGSPQVTNNNDNGALYAPLFHDTPYREFWGHKQDILSLDWSKNNFLLSSSMDRTVRLWHVDRNECLQVFKHSDFVTCAKFHPTDDRFFVSGSLDKKIRLWSVLDGEASYVQEVPSMITACEFFPSGKSVIVGTINGLVYVFETKGLHLNFHFDLKKNYIKNSSGAKISGLECFETMPDDNGNTDIRVLITTNDSRVRLYSCVSKKLLMKFKGLENTSSQAMAVTSHTHSLVLSASEDHMVYLWQVDDPEVLNKAQQKKSKGINIFKKPAKETASKKQLGLGDEDLPESIKNSNYYAFHAHNSCVTSAVFVPERTKKLLYLSNDPIYDLNRTFRTEVFDRGTDILKNLNSVDSSQQKELKEVGNFLKRILSRSSSSSDDTEDKESMTLEPNSPHDVKSGTAGLLEGSKNDGPETYINLLRKLKHLEQVDSLLALLDPLKYDIIVSADEKGKIRVFRIDSAYQIRKILQEDILYHKGLKKHSHEDPKVNLQRFLRQLNHYEDFLVSHHMNALSIGDSDEIIHAFDNKKKRLRNKKRASTFSNFRLHGHHYGNNNNLSTHVAGTGTGAISPSASFLSPATSHSTAPNDSAASSPVVSGLPQSGNIEVSVDDHRRIPSAFKKFSRSNASINKGDSNHTLQADPERPYRQNTDTAALKELIADQNNATYSDIKEKVKNDSNRNLMSPMKNGSFYSSNNGNGSLTSLLRGRSGSTKQVCEVCQGTKFVTKKLQYKGNSTVAKVCQDCGNQLG